MGVGGGWMWGGTGTGMFVGMFVWVLVIMGVAILAVRVVQKSTGGGHRGTKESALDILNRRYARGEIGREEYDEKKGAIS